MYSICTCRVIDTIWTKFLNKIIKLKCCNKYTVIKVTFAVSAKRWINDAWITRKMWHRALTPTPLWRDFPFLRIVELFERSLSTICFSVSSCYPHVKHFPSIFLFHFLLSQFNGSFPVLRARIWNLHLQSAKYSSHPDKGCSIKKCRRGETPHPEKRGAGVGRGEKKRGGCLWKKRRGGGSAQEKKGLVGQISEGGSPSPSHF